MEPLMKLLIISGLLALGNAAPAGEAVLNSLVGGLVDLTKKEAADGSLKEVQIMVENEAGMDQEGVNSPSSYRIKQKLYRDPIVDEETEGITISGPTYPFGLANVLLQQCFGQPSSDDKCASLKTTNTRPCKRMLDAVSFMGVGFDVTETYTADSKRKSLLQRVCSEGRKFHERSVPDNLLTQGVYTYNVYTKSYESAESYQHELAQRAGVTESSSTFSKEMTEISGRVSGGAFGFGAEISASKSTGKEESQSESSSTDTESEEKSSGETKTYLAVLEADILLFEMFQDAVKPDHLRWEFVSEFMALPDSYFVPGAIAQYQDFLLRWGTHYVKYAKFGGRMRIIKKRTATKEESFSRFKTRSEHEFQRMTATMSSAQVQAKIKTPWASAEAGYKKDREDREEEGVKVSKEEEELSKSYQEDAFDSTSFQIQGGDQVIAASIFDVFTPKFKTSFKFWLESILDFPKPFDFRLGDIADLVDFNVQSLFGQACSFCFTGDTSGLNCTLSYGNITITYPCDDINNIAEISQRKRQILRNAITVYLTEGPVSPYEFHLPAASSACLQPSSRAKHSIHPKWSDISGVNYHNVRILFDMRSGIGNRVRRNEVLQVMRDKGLWFVVKYGKTHLYDSSDDVNDHGSTIISIRGLNFKYNEDSGLLCYLAPPPTTTTTTTTTTSSPIGPVRSISSIVTRAVSPSRCVPVAKAEYINSLAALIPKVPCNFYWSNIHKSNFEGRGRCLRFTAKSIGDIFVMFSSIPKDPDSWYYVQISPNGVAMYKSLEIKDTVLYKGARSLGSDVLFQTYYVCVEYDDNTAVVQYGKVDHSEDKTVNVWMSYKDSENRFAPDFYTFGAGNDAVDVMEITTVEATTVKFICKKDLRRGKHGSCEKDCHKLCHPQYSCTMPQDPYACDFCDKFTLLSPNFTPRCVKQCPTNLTIKPYSETYKSKLCVSAVDPCSSQPCQNGGTCIANDHGYTCTCPPPRTVSIINGGTQTTAIYGTTCGCVKTETKRSSTGTQTVTDTCSSS